MGDRPAHTLVVGVGNVLLADEGVGVHAANLLQAARLPEHVRVMECGTNFMAAATHLRGARKVVIVDAVRAGSKPGTIHRLTYEELERAGAGLRFAHQVSLLSSLRLLRLAEPALAKAEVILLGVEPATVSGGMEMSPEVRAALPRLIEAVRAEL
ncbi:MAG: hydrogenase maturation protease [bacterium]|jgi:hydrogenase maturation protease|nr:hydrogenase maturation protease [candidate division KSB1 bacterium]MDH7560022.1 hydrogenase maturation protease [bacterium]